MKSEVKSLHNSVPHLKKTKKPSLLASASDKQWQRDKEMEGNCKQYPTAFPFVHRIRKCDTFNPHTHMHSKDVYKITMLQEMQCPKPCTKTNDITKNTRLTTETSISNMNIRNNSMTGRIMNEGRHSGDPFSLHKIQNSSVLLI